MGRSRLLVERRASKPAASASQPLQAKRRATGAATAAPDLQAQLQHASRYGHSLGAMPIQADLVIGQPNDKYEQEADAVAASAVQRQPAATAAQTQPEPQTVQRQDAPPGLGDLGGLEKMGDPAELGAEQIGDLGTADPAGAGGAEGGSPGAEAAPAKGGDEEAAAGESLPEEMLPPEVKDQIEAAGAGGGDDPSGDVEAKIQRAMSSGGSPPTEEEQASLRDRLGILNPEVIVIHDDNEAAELCDMLSARAFTTQNHIFFGVGERGDLELLFHEAVHTIQQGAVEAAPPEEEMPDDAGTGSDAGALEDNLMTPDEDKAPLTDMVMTKPATPGLIQRDEGEQVEKSQEDQENEAAEQGEKDKEAAADEMGGGDIEEGVEEVAVGDLGDRAEAAPGDAEPGEPEDVDMSVEEAEVDEEDVPDEADLSEYEGTFWTDIVDTDVEGWDDEVAAYDLFQGAASDRDGFDIDEFFEGTSYDGIGSELEETANLDRDALIGQAFLSGFVEGLIEGGIQLAIQVALFAVMSAFPSIAPGLGAVLILSQLHDPKALAMSFAKGITDSWDKISGIGNIFSGDAVGWEAAALFFEFLLGIVMMVKTIMDIVDTIMQIVGALCFVLAKILYAIPFGIGVPAAIPLEAFSILMFNISKVLGIIKLFMTLGVIMPLQLLCMALRALDLKFSDATPEELLEKQKSLTKHTKDFTKNGISSAGKLGMDAYKAKNPHPLKGQKSDKSYFQALKADYDKAFDPGKFSYSGIKADSWAKYRDWKSTKEFGGLFDDYHGSSSFQAVTDRKTGRLHKDIYEDLFKDEKKADGTASWFKTSINQDSGEGDTTDEALIGDPVKAASAGIASGIDAFTTSDEGDAAVTAYNTEEALRDRIVEGAEELPEPPYEETIVAYDAATFGLLELQESRIELQGLRSANNWVRGEAQDSVTAHQVMKGTAEGHKQVAIDQQADLDDKMQKQDVAGQGAAETAGDQAEIGSSAKGLGGQTNAVEPQMKQSAEKGAKEGAGTEGGPDEAAAGEGLDQSDQALEMGAKAVGGQGGKLVEQWKNDSKAAQAESKQNEAELDNFSGQMDENTEQAEEAIEGTNGNEEELQAAEEGLEEGEEELLAAREEAIAAGQEWVEEHAATREAIYDDLEDLIRDGGEESEQADLSENLEDGSLQGEELDGITYEDEDLSGISLMGASLAGADLSGTNLSGCDLLTADLTGADLSEADLSDADLGAAYLRGADLKNADLTNADLTNADLTLADLTGADLSNADLDGAELEDAILDGVVGYAAP